MTDRVQAQWVAADWGTTSLRVWAMAGDKALASASSEDGMSSLSKDGFEPALLGLVGPWLVEKETQVVACGMVGARQGWAEAPYVPVPARPSEISLMSVPQGDSRIRAHIVPGLKQSSPADVMRGEETQVAGFLSANPGWDGVVCLPGTHTKWVRVKGGEVSGIRTYMTGELYALLGRQSVLRHSMGDGGWDEGAFAEAVSTVRASPGQAFGELFSIRARDLLLGEAGPVSRARLSGLLIGSEVATAQPYWEGHELAVVGASGTSDHYASAIGSFGVEAMCCDATQMVLLGLTKSYQTLNAAS